MSNVKVDYSVTLKALRRAGACYSGYNKVVRSLQGLPFTPADADRESYIRYANNDKIGLQFILNSNGLDDAVWTLRCIDNVERDTRLYAIWCARQVQSIITDSRYITALDVAERYVNGQATKVELNAASDAARAAARAATWDASDARTASAAASAAAWAASAAAWAASAAARAATWDASDARAVSDAASAAAWAAWAASAAARAATWDASDARAASDAAQKEMFNLMINGCAPWQQ